MYKNQKNKNSSIDDWNKQIAQATFLKGFNQNKPATQFGFMGSYSATSSNANGISAKTPKPSNKPYTPVTPEKINRGQKPYESLDFVEFVDNDYDINKNSPFGEFPLTGKLGIRTGKYGENKNHSGINRKMPEGTFIKLPIDVKYKNSGYNYNTGNWIELEDDSGNLLSYRDLMDFGDYKPGDIIPKNTPFARSGKSSRGETLREEYYSPEGRNITESYWKGYDAKNTSPLKWQQLNSSGKGKPESIISSENTEKQKTAKEAYNKWWDDRYYKNHSYVPQTEEEQVILNNAQNIKDAAKEHGVNPAILASCIYTEHTTNINWKDDFDRVLYFRDTSIGVAQVKVSTAEMLEDLGYMPKTPKYTVGGKIINRQEAIADKLMDDATCIRYAAAYLRYFQDRWKKVYPEIDGRTGILATLYNQGEKNPPHANPKPSPEFGEKALESYDLMKNILGMKE